MKEFFLRLFGYKYVVNHRSKEIHDLTKEQKNCKLDLMAEDNKQYITKKKRDKLFNAEEPYNGCKWCLTEFNKE